MSVTDPLSIVQFAPISTPSSNITFPICGDLKFLFLIGINPKPLTPIFEPSFILTKSLINEFLIVTKEPIIQPSPISTLLSITLLFPIYVFFQFLHSCRLEHFFQRKHLGI